jgi:xanthine dehydrogenase small subunit
VAVELKTLAALSDAVQALSTDRTARFISGGTLLMRAMNEGETSINTFVRTTDAAYRRINASGARVEIGAGARMIDVLKSRELEFLHPVARAVGGPAIRAMATVGGNLFAAAPYGDFAVALLALDAQVAVHAGFGAPQLLAIEQFLQGRNRGVPGIVANVTLSRPDQAGVFRFRKVSRVKPKGISVLSIAARLPMSGGRITNARIAYGAMAPTPVRAKAVERALEGRVLDEAGIAPALAVATEGVSPATDAIASDWYRREILPVHLKRLLLSLPN